MTTTTPYYNAASGTTTTTTTTSPMVIVQGQTVSSGASSGGRNQKFSYSYHHHPQDAAAAPLASNFHNAAVDMHQGTRQPKQCRDVFWALLFYIHLGAILVLAIIYTPTMATILSSNSNNNNSNNNNSNYGGARRALKLLRGGHDDPTASLSSLSFNSMVTIVTDWIWKACQQLSLIHETSTTTTISFPHEYHRSLQQQQQQEYQQSSSSSNLNVSAVLVVLSVCGVVGLLVASLALIMIMNFAAGLIKLALVLHVALLIGLAVWAGLAGAMGLAILLLIGSAVSLCFTCGAWNRIPFGASNLTTAVTAVRANMGLTFFAYQALIAGFVWSILWSLAAISTLFVMSDCNANGQCSNQTPVVSVVAILFLLSYHWTAQVIFNVVHVTTAGTVGTWWFAPQEANSCCSKAVCDSYFRAMTWSFGSICFGSLLVAIIETVRDLVRSAREQGDSMLMCLADCLLACIESLAESFCKWAYVYVGLYGYSFLEAGSNVMTLFRNRGWTTIITDALVETVLVMFALAVGVLTGVIGLVIGAGMSPNEKMVYFLIGFVVGWVMCATLFSVVSSAVNTVIVCYAEAPNEFQANHPQLSNQMRAAWRQAWPVDFHY